MIRCVVMVLDWSRHMHMALFALKVLIASFPPEVDLHLTTAVRHLPGAVDERRAIELLSSLGAPGRRIASFEVERIADLKVTPPLLLLELGDFDQTLEQVCSALARIAAQSLDGKNVAQIADGIDASLF